MKHCALCRAEARREWAHDLARRIPLLRDRTRASTLASWLVFFGSTFGAAQPFARASTVMTSTLRISVVGGLGAMLLGWVILALSCVALPLLEWFSRRPMPRVALPARPPEMHIGIAYRAAPVTPPRLSRLCGRHEALSRQNAGRALPRP